MATTSVDPGVVPEPTLLRAVVVVYLGLVAAFGVGASIVAFRDHFDVLFVDDWRVLDHYQSQGLLAYLFTAENGHLMPVTLALFAMDYEWFGGRMRLLVLASTACMALTAGLLWRIFRRHDGLGSALSRSLFGFACFSLFWAASCNELLKGLYQMNLQTVALVALALGALGRVDPARIRESWGSLSLAMLASLLATLSQGAGAAIWAALVTVAAVRRFPWRIVGGFAATGAAVLGLVAATLPPDPRVSFRDSLTFVARRPFALASFTLAFVGSTPARILIGLGIGEPVPKTPKRSAWVAHTRDLFRISVAFGALGLFHFLLVALRCLGRPIPRSALDAVSVGLMAFALGAALLVAFVRASIVGPGALVQPRFLCWATLFWIGAFCALVPRTPERIPGSLASLAAVAFPLVSVCMIPALRDLREFHETTRSQASRLTLSLLLGLRNEDLASGVSLEDAELVYRVASRLESEGRWPFQGPRYRLRGTSLGERFAMAEPCAGAVDRVRAIGSVGAAAVSGWIVRPTGWEALRFVVLADEGGVVRGIADSASVPPRYASGLGGKRLGWTGFIADYDPSMRYSAYAVLGDGSTSCPLRMP